MSTFLITGVNGFIGSHIAERLLSDGHIVKGLVRKTSDLSFIRDMNIQLIHGDITRPDSLPAALDNTDIVVHVAGLASDWGKFSEFYRINTQGTMNVARAAAEHGVKRFVQISTVAFYGFGRDHAVRETDPVVPSIFPYNETKRLAEEWLFDFGKSCKMEITAIRPGNVFGPRDHTFIEKYLKALEEGKLAYIHGGTSKTCPTYIENLIDAVMSACFSENAAGEAFFITDGLDINWKQFTDALADEMKLPRPKLSVPFRPVYLLSLLMELVYKLLRIKTAPLLTRYRICNGGLNYYFSIEKAEKMLGYQPSVGFEEAVKKTVHWYRNRL